MPGPLAILAGTGLTMLVQSSSITTSLLTPFVALGTIKLEAMLPLTLGANIGTTVTGVLAALVGDSIVGFQVAMIHVLFNVFGVLIFYPVPIIRRLPIRAAKALGYFAFKYKLFPIIYILLAFFAWPLLILGISIGFSNNDAGSIVGASIGLVIILVTHIGFFVWYKYMNGKEIMESKFGYTTTDNDEEDMKTGMDMRIDKLMDKDVGPVAHMGIDIDSDLVEDEDKSDKSENYVNRYKDKHDYSDGDSDTSRNCAI